MVLEKLWKRSNTIRAPELCRDPFVAYRGCRAAEFCKCQVGSARIFHDIEISPNHHHVSGQVARMRV